jgi:potassium/chloride transporter 4/5/6
MLDDHLMQTRVLNMPPHADIKQICKYCRKSEEIGDQYCETNTSAPICKIYTGGDLKCVNAFPGINGLTLRVNLDSQYLTEGQARMAEKQADRQHEVFQDVTTSFFLLLAIYFPAVTGIMTGTNMSGDLKDPQKSIPSGTIAATLSTSFIYFTLALLFGSSIIGPVLRDKNGKSISSHMIVASLSWPSPWVVIVGSFLSTFGAALQVGITSKQK